MAVGETARHCSVLAIELFQLGWHRPPELSSNFSVLESVFGHHYKHHFRSAVTDTRFCQFTVLLQVGRESQLNFSSEKHTHAHMISHHVDVSSVFQTETAATDAGLSQSVRTAWSRLTPLLQLIDCRQNSIHCTAAHHTMLTAHTQAGRLYSERRGTKPSLPESQ